MKKVKTLVMNNLDFNEKEELEVYKSMRKNLKNSFLKKSESVGENEIQLYTEWHRYVERKYKKCKKSDLINFSKVLEYRGREKNTKHEGVRKFWGYVSTAVVSYLLIDFVIKPNVNISPVWVQGLVTIAFSCIAVAIICSMVKFSDYLCERYGNIEGFFYKEYKMIIDDIISDRKK